MIIVSYFPLLACVVAKAPEARPSLVEEDSARAIAIEALLVDKRIDQLHDELQDGGSSGPLVDNSASPVELIVPMMPVADIGAPARQHHPILTMTAVTTITPDSGAPSEDASAKGATAIDLRSLYRDQIRLNVDMGILLREQVPELRNLTSHGMGSALAIEAGSLLLDCH